MSDPPDERGERSETEQTKSVKLLEGNGAALVRERALSGAVQRALERLYQLDRPVETSTTSWRRPRSGSGRLSSCVRRRTVRSRWRFEFLGSANRRSTSRTTRTSTRSVRSSKGVSHFVYLANRAHVDREATQLELDASRRRWTSSSSSQRRSASSISAPARCFDVGLYEDVAFTHEASTEDGHRYRVANVHAHSFVRRLEREYLEARRWGRNAAAEALDASIAWAVKRSSGARLGRGEKGGRGSRALGDA